MEQVSRRGDDAMRSMEREQLWRIRLAVALPFGLALLVVIIFAGIALWLPTAAQVSILANSLLILLALCPLAIVMLPLVVLSIAMVIAMTRMRSRARSPLRRLESWTAVAEARIEGWLGRIDRQALDWAVRLAPFRQLLTAFDPPEEARSDEEEA